MTGRCLRGIILVGFWFACVAAGGHVALGDETHWKTIIVDAQGDVGEFSYIVIHDGYPMISYLDAEPHCRVKFAYQDKNGWHFEIVDQDSVVGRFTSLDIINGQPAIAYRDSTFHRLKYAWKEDGEWHTMVVADCVEEGTGPCDLRMDHYGDLVGISYRDNGTKFLSYAWRIGSEGPWTVETVDPDDPDVGENWTCLKYDPATGYPHITYYHSYNVVDLNCAWKDEEGWHIEIVDEGYDIGRGGLRELKNNVGRYSSLSFGGGYPAVAYYHYTNGDLRYAYKLDGEWHIEEVDTVGDVGRHPSLAFYNGEPTIAYHDVTRGKLKFARRHNGRWECSDVDFLAEWSGWISMAYNGDVAYISHHDNYEGDLRLSMGFPSELFTAPRTLLRQGWNWLSIPAVPDRPEVETIFRPAQGLANRLLRWNSIDKNYELYPDDFTEMEMGRGYMLWVGFSIAPAMEFFGTRTREDGSVLVAAPGLCFLGLPRDYPVAMEDLVVVRPGAPPRTAWADYRSPDPWLNWAWSYWDSTARTLKLCALSGGDTDTIEPWRGYFLWSNVGLVRIETPYRP